MSRNFFGTFSGKSCRRSSGNSRNEFPAVRDETSLLLPTGSIILSDSNKHQAAANDSPGRATLMGSSRPQPKGLAAKLRRIRTSLGLTQQEMVKRLKSQRVQLTLYPGNISRLEHGLREPPLLVLLAYASVARATMDVLVDEDLDLSGHLSVSTGK